jgi:dipeptidyl aminopeptidase/acylaminoacyl peptidase
MNRIRDGNPPTNGQVRETQVVGVATTSEAVALVFPTTEVPPPTQPPPLPTLTQTAVLATQTPGATISAATGTPILTVTTTPEPKTPVIGGADKIAFLNKGEIWVANLDGTGLESLTNDGMLKTNLQWTPDGQGIVYIAGKCVRMANITSKQADSLVCFNYVENLEAFEISPDGKKVAISLDHQLYLVPYDPERLGQVKVRTDLTEIAECKELAPYTRTLIENARWSKDSSKLATIVLGALEGKRVDYVQVLDISSCVPNPGILDNFPAKSRFTMKGYDKNPIIENIAWDGNSLFALNSYIRNEGFGDLYIYNMELHKAESQVNPIGQACCYRDPQWSPDGSYLAFAFQNYLSGSRCITQIYYLEAGSLGTGGNFEPLPLPEITDPKEKPQPILRPAVPGG